MSNESKITNNNAIFNQILFADIGADFATLAPTTANNSKILSNITTSQFDLTGIVTGGGRESTKIDLGVDRPLQYRLDVVLESVGTWTVDQTFDFYWAGSNFLTALKGNAIDITGTDAAYVDTPAGLSALQRIGSLTATADAICKGRVGIMIPELRYGGLVMVSNNTTTFNSAGNMDETYCVLTPISYAS